jgi:hypothetical protein
MMSLQAGARSLDVPVVIARDAAVLGRGVQEPQRGVDRVVVGGARPVVEPVGDQPPPAVVGEQPERAHRVVVPTGREQQAGQADHRVAAPVREPGVARDDRVRAVLGGAALDDEVLGGVHEAGDRVAVVLGCVRQPVEHGVDACAHTRGPRRPVPLDRLGLHRVHRGVQRDRPRALAGVHEFARAEHVLDRRLPALGVAEVLEIVPDVGVVPVLGLIRDQMHARAAGGAHHAALDRAGLVVARDLLARHQFVEVAEGRERAEPERERPGGLDVVDQRHRVPLVEEVERLGDERLAGWGVDAVRPHGLEPAREGAGRGGGGGAVGGALEVEAGERDRALACAPRVDGQRVGDGVERDDAVDRGVRAPTSRPW